MRIQAKGRTPENGGYEFINMNSLEKRYSLHLENLKMAGEILFWRYEPFALHLANRTTYKPDFLVVNRMQEVEIHETKGFWREDARVKIKCASATFPIFTFMGVQWKKGGWVYEQFRP